MELYGDLPPGVGALTNYYENAEIHDGIDSGAFAEECLALWKGNRTVTIDTVTHVT